LTSQATLTARPLSVKRVIGPMPDLPTNRPAQVSAMLRPNGVMAPIPVMTTRRVFMG
jgi:hypothetical protein